MDGQTDGRTDGRLDRLIDRFDVPNYPTILLTLMPHLLVQALSIIRPYIDGVE